MDAVMENFIDKQHDEAKSLAEGSDILSLVPMGPAPCQRYVAVFNAKGLVQDASGDIVEADRADFGIWMPDEYLRRADAARSLCYLGPHPRPWHPNIRPPFVCAHIRAGTPLVDLIYTCFELWTWALFATGDDGLHPAASQWARNQPRDRFPIDRRPLKRRSLDFRVTVNG